MVHPRELNPNKQSSDEALRARASPPVSTLLRLGPTKVKSKKGSDGSLGAATALTVPVMDIEDAKAGFEASCGEVGERGESFCTGGGLSGGSDFSSEGKGWLRSAASGRAEGNRACLNLGCGCGCVCTGGGGAGVGVGGSAFGERSVVLTLFRSDD